MWIGIAYPTFLFVRFFLFFDPSFWMFDFPVMVFLLFVLPVFSAVALFVLRLAGNSFAWPAIVIFSMWIGVVDWVFFYYLAAIAASV